MISIYDPQTRRFSGLLPYLRVSRIYHTATLLANGRVLIAGGGDTVATASTELYSPLSSGQPSPGPNMIVARTGHTATVLPDLRVLIAGGSTDVWRGQVTNSAEIYDPFTNTFSTTGNMTTARTGHRAERLPDGKVLIMGGTTLQNILASTEIYDPSTGTFTPAGSMVDGRVGPEVAPLD